MFLAKLFYVLVFGIGKDTVGRYNVASSGALCYDRRGVGSVLIVEMHRGLPAMYFCDE
jgi:hypothetical protein